MYTFTLAFIIWLNWMLTFLTIQDGNKSINRKVQIGHRLEWQSWLLTWGMTLKDADNENDSWTKYERKDSWSRSLRHGHAFGTVTTNITRLMWRKRLFDCMGTYDLHHDCIDMTDTGSSLWKDAYYRLRNMGPSTELDTQDLVTNATFKSWDICCKARLNDGDDRAGMVNEMA